MTIEITPEEADMIRQSLNELGTRRLEQSIERSDRHLRSYAETFLLLADRIPSAPLPVEKNPGTF